MHSSPQREFFDRYSEPLARRSDPETSVRAGDQQRPSLSENQLKVYQAFVHLMDATAYEAAELASCQYGMTIETARKRVVELRRKGWIRQVDVRPCTTSGKSAAVYRATGYGPNH